MEFILWIISKVNVCFSVLVPAVEDDVCSVIFQKMELNFSREILEKVQDDICTHKI